MKSAYIFCMASLMFIGSASAQYTKSGQHYLGCLEGCKNPQRRNDALICETYCGCVIEQMNKAKNQKRIRDAIGSGKYGRVSIVHQEMWNYCADYTKTTLNLE